VETDAARLEAFLHNREHMIKINDGIVELTEDVVVPSAVQIDVVSSAAELTVSPQSSDIGGLVVLE